MDNLKILQSLCTSINPNLSLEDNVLEELAKRRNKKKRVCFFCPQAEFEGNFGLTPYYLDKNSVEVIWLYGDGESFLASTNKNKFLIINEMISKVKGVDAIVSGSVMDCLPKNIKKILIDHISFAPLDLENHIKLIENGKKKLPNKYEKLSNIFETYTAFIAFTPFYNLILASNESTFELTCKALTLSGYKSIKKVYSNKRLNKNSIKKFVDLKKYTKKIKVSKVGYPKLDIIQKRNKDIYPDNIIVYAPTPNDISGNKKNKLWQSAITINDYGSSLIETLCRNFPDYRIIFKPYKLELKEIVNKIFEKNKKFNNFNLDKSGSSYWDLYSKTKILISDSSSTAYTFSLGTKRPVIFFSPKESALDTDILEGTYMSNRKNIGMIANSLNEVVEAIKNINKNYSKYIEKVEFFSNNNFVNPSLSSEYAAREIIDLLNNKTNSFKIDSENFVLETQFISNFKNISNRIKNKFKSGFKFLLKIFPNN